MPPRHRPPGGNPRCPRGVVVPSVTTMSERPSGRTGGGRRAVITLDFLADLAALAYVLVLVLAAFDVVVPILPSESAVILGGVLAWQGRLHPVPLIAGGGGRRRRSATTSPTASAAGPGAAGPSPTVGATGAGQGRAPAGLGRPPARPAGPDAADRGPLHPRRPHGRPRSWPGAPPTRWRGSRPPVVAAGCSGRASPPCSATSAAAPSTTRRCWPRASASLLALGFAALIELVMSRRRAPPAAVVAEPRPPRDTDEHRRLIPTGRGGRGGPGRADARGLAPRPLA